MPQYKVKSPGYYKGELYDPAGKRPTLHVDKAFTRCPRWLKPMQGETAAEKGARTKALNKEAEEAKLQAAEDKKSIDAVTFVTSAEQTTQTL
jgi:uncharacterized damage-inducible protein DinB